VVFDYPKYIGMSRQLEPGAELATKDNDPTAVPVRFKISERVWEYNSVVNAFKSGGIRRTKSSTTWNLFWGRHLAEEQYRALRHGQRVNHFPGTWCLGRKDRLAENVSKARRNSLYPDEYDFLPETFVIPRERSSLERTMAHDKENGKS
jgi:tubulin polyglutamylase TTLL4